MNETESAVEQVLSYLENRQYHELRHYLENEEAADVAGWFLEIPREYFLLLFRILPKELAAEVFVELEPDVQETLLRAFSDEELGQVVERLFVDDTVELIEEMPANVVHRIIANTTPEKRSAVNALLQYPRDSAGSGMTTEFVELKTQMTAADVFKKIKRSGIDRETIYDCYVTDRSRRLIGVLSIKDLLITKAENPTVGELMQTEPISANVLDSEEDVARRLQKYGFLAMPIVDNENRLVGILTYDDAMHVLSENDSEDMEIMAAITPTDTTYLRTPVFALWKARIPWLLILMLSSTFTSRILQSFEDALVSCAALTAFIPMLMGTGGNAGAQVSVTVIRGLSLGEIRMRDVFRILWKEWRVSLLCGLTLSIVNFGKMLLIDRVTILVAITVSLTVLAVVVIAKLVGGLMPVLAKRLGFDPAVMANPFITTIVDILSLLLYFFIAGRILGI